MMKLNWKGSRYGLCLGHTPRAACSTPSATTHDAAAAEAAVAAARAAAAATEVQHTSRKRGSLNRERMVSSSSNMKLPKLPRCECYSFVLREEPNLCTREIMRSYDSFSPTTPPYLQQQASRDTRCSRGAGRGAAGGLA